MSANLEVVRSIFVAWERGDFRAVDWADPDIDFVIDDGISRSGGSGVAAMGELWREFLGSWEAWQTEVQEYRELDPERVLVLLRLSGRGKRSGVEVAQMSAVGVNVFHLHEGKVTELSIYLDGERALAELGLSP
jgi:ketosteroid isomerase-like protein